MFTVRCVTKYIVIKMRENSIRPNEKLWTATVDPYEFAGNAERLNAWPSTFPKCFGHYLLSSWPWPLTFWPQNLISSSFSQTAPINLVKFGQAVCVISCSQTFSVRPSTHCRDARTDSPRRLIAGVRRHNARLYNARNVSCDKFQPCHWPLLASLALRTLRAYRVHTARYGAVRRRTLTAGNRA